MSLDIPAALEDGFSRALTRVAAILVVVYLVVGAISTVTTQTLAVAVTDALQLADSTTGAGMPPGAGSGAGGASPLALDVGLPVAVALFLAQIVVAQAVGVVTIRTFVSDARRTFPQGVTRRFGWVVVNALVAGFIVNVLIGLGTVLLVLPGIYLAVALYFVQFEVIVEDKNAIDALRDGWELTKGERLGVFLLLLVVFAIGLVSALPGIILQFVGVSPPAITAVTVVVGAVTGVVSSAIGARAYVQLKPSGWSPPGGGPSPFA
ncbi:MAG: hypothetical protein ABEJ73_08615 [Haloplanus sp.]